MSFWCICVRFPRGRWSDDLASDPWDLSSPDQSEQELEDKKEESSNEEARGDHVYQSLDRRERSLVSEPVYALPHKQPKVRFHWKILNWTSILKHWKHFLIWN